MNFVPGNRLKLLRIYLGDTWNGAGMVFSELH